MKKVEYNRLVEENKRANKLINGNIMFLGESENIYIPISLRVSIKCHVKRVYDRESNLYYVILTFPNIGSSYLFNYEYSDIFRVRQNELMKITDFLYSNSTMGIYPPCILDNLKILSAYE